MPQLLFFFHMCTYSSVLDTHGCTHPCIFFLTDFAIDSVVANCWEHEYSSLVSEGFVFWARVSIFELRRKTWYCQGNDVYISQVCSRANNTTSRITSWNVSSLQNVSVTFSMRYCISVSCQLNRQAFLVLLSSRSVVRTVFLWCETT